MTSEASQCPEICATCGGPVSGDLAGLGGMCPTCLFGSARTPDLFAREERPSNTSSWADHFPQLEVERVLKETEEGSVYLTRTLGEERPRRAVLQVLAGKSLEDAGGVAALVSRTRSLVSSPLSGVQPVIDFGDLQDAYFLVTEAPEEPLLADAAALKAGEAEGINRLLSHLEIRSREITRDALDSGIHLRLDPTLAFVGSDPDSLTFTPSLLSEPGGEETVGSVPGHSFDSSPGRKLGPFVLEEKIGEGGFGEVWSARQERPIERKVAIKILKQDLHSTRSRNRFDIERQALARLEHPNIARLYEAGTTPGDRPFFAMEWIDGCTLDEFLKRESCPLDLRLELFAQICRAVEHAHQKGILHRDLKPSNILVVEGEEGEYSIKVIDFGIARALEDEPLGEQTLLTRSQDVMGTPVAMSPEQILGSADPDARTDVYGLGVVLYQLLTEEYPFAPKLPYDELRRVIREEDPEKPSARVSSDRFPARLVAGDLDWIVMKCLEKGQGRRYASVDALLSDLERHRKDEPVEAGPPEWSYRAHKFLRRHRIALAAAAIVLLALVAGGVAATFGLLSAEKEKKVAQQEREQALRARDDARREAAIAEAVSGFLSEELLTLEDSNGLLVADPRNQTVSLRTVLERAAGRIEGRFSDFPEVEGVLRHSLAASLFSVGDLDGAGHQADKALKRLEDSLGGRDERTLESLKLLASVRVAEGKVEDAEQLLDRLAALTNQDSGGTPSTPTILEANVIRGDLLLELGMVPDAKNAYFSVLFLPQKKMERRPGVPVALRVAAMSGVARCSEHLEKRSRALINHEKVVAFAKANLGDEHPRTLEAMSRHAGFLMNMEEASGEEVTVAVPMSKLVQKLQTEQLGRDHPATLLSRFDDAMARGDVTLLAPGARRDLDAVVGAAERIYRAGHPELLRFRLGRAIQHGKDGGYQRSMDLLQGIIDAGKASVGENHPVVVEALRRLADQTEKLGPERQLEALALRTRAVEMARKGMSTAARARQFAVKTLGETYWSTDRTPDAAKLFRDEKNFCSRELGEQHWLTSEYLDRMMISFTHDQTGGAARIAAELALHRGGTANSVIRSMQQLALASQMCLRPSLFGQPSVPLPPSYWTLVTNRTEGAATAKPEAVLPAPVRATASWRFLPIGEKELAPAGWIGPSFDDSGWTSGAAPLGFGKPEITTDIRGSDPNPDGRGNLATVCFRHRFHVEKINLGKPLLLRLQCDDGAVVHLNGEELLRVNLPPGRLKPGALALRAVGDSDSVDFLVPPGGLVEGANLVAVQVFQANPSSSDLFFSLALHGEAPLPLELLPSFDAGPALEAVHVWFPDMAKPLEEDWRVQVECMTMACLGSWSEALDLCRTLSLERDSAVVARLRWFERAALKQLGREGEAERRFRQAIPARDPAASARMIDLTGHCNALLDEPWYVMSGGIGHDAALEDFPAGSGTYGGIDFDVRGLVQLGGSKTLEHEVVRSYPGLVEGIEIGQSVGRLHFLGACLRDDQPEAVAGVLVHYQDGSTERFPIRNRKETLTLQIGTETIPDPVRLGWRGPDPSRPGSDKALYIATWTNPRPEVPVHSIDLAAMPGRQPYFVAGITVAPVQ